MVDLAFVDVRAIVDLRRRVLRGDDPGAEVIVSGDHVEGCFHFGLLEDDVVVGCVSAFPENCPDVAGVNAWQFRFMAVDQQRQGEGFGRILLTALLQELAGRGAEVAWANGRDTAQGFYETMGFTIVEGSAHWSPSTGLPHHRIYKMVSKDGAK